MQESLLMIRKERTGCKELDTTELPSTHKERTEGTLEERGGGHAERGNASRGLGYRVFKARLFA